MQTHDCKVVSAIDQHGNGLLGRNFYQNLIVESQIGIYKRVYEVGAKPLHIFLKVFT